MAEMIAEKVGILVGSYHIILSKDLKMHCICQHIPRLLMQKQCYDCMRISAADNDQNFSDRSSQVRQFT
jgi:hypothetical protein